MNDINQRGAKFAQLVSRCIVPIFRDQDGKWPRHVGTGFLVTDERDYYLVSAAHVFDSLKKEPLYFPISETWRVFFGKNGVLTSLPQSGDRQKDNCDVGVFRLDLDGTQFAALQATKQPIHISLLVPHALPRDRKEYMMVGTPASQSKFHKFHKDIRTKYHTLLCSHSDYRSYDRLGVTPLANIILAFNKKRLFTLSGTKWNFPDLHGMSGSPIFLFEDKNRIIDPRITPIVGVFTSWPNQSSELLATDVRQILKFIKILRSSAN